MVLVNVEHTSHFGKQCNMMESWVSIVSILEKVGRIITRPHCMDHFAHAPSQWETTLRCNIGSHWLGAYTEWSLHYRPTHHAGSPRCRPTHQAGSLQWWARVQALYTPDWDDRRRACRARPPVAARWSGQFPPTDGAGIWARLSGFWHQEHDHYKTKIEFFLDISRAV